MACRTPPVYVHRDYWLFYVYYIELCVYNIYIYHIQCIYIYMHVIFVSIYIYVFILLHYVIFIITISDVWSDIWSMIIIWYTTHTHNVIWFTYTTYSYMCNILIWKMYIHACGCTLSKDPAWILLWRRKSLDCHFTEKATREKILTWHAQFPLHSICVQNLWIIWWSRQGFRFWPSQEGFRFWRDQRL